MLFKKKPKSADNDERRQYVRIKKNFILTYFDKANPSIKKDATQLKNISLGGMCFITSRTFEKGTHLVIELRTPYMAETTIFEGTVQQSHEKLPNIIYETRIKFENISSQAQFLIEKLEEFIENVKKEGKK